MFSGLDCQEDLFNYHIAKGLISDEDLAWLGDKGYLRNGMINFSDRFPALFSEIESGLGTYQYKANDSIRKNLIPECMLPYSDKNYFDKGLVTTQMVDLTREFCRRFTFNWYWTSNPSEALKKSPLMAVVRFSNGEGILHPEGPLNHAIMVYEEKDNYYGIDDNYSQQDKKYRKDYVYSFCGYSLTINNNNMDKAKFITENDLKFIRNTNTGQFGRIMQGKLRVVTSDDRGTLMLLDNEHRNNGISISNKDWAELPKQEF